MEKSIIILVHDDLSKSENFCTRQHFSASWSTRRVKQLYGEIQLVSERKTVFGGIISFLADSLEFQGLEDCCNPCKHTRLVPEFAMYTLVLVDEISLT